MDANGTRFHLLLGKDDWAQCIDADTEMPLSDAWNASPPSFASAVGEQNEATSFGWDEARQELTLQPRLFQFVAAPKDTPPLLSQRRGAGRDSYGNWYWIRDSNSELLVNSAGTGVTSHFWSPDDTVQQPARTGIQKGAFHPLEAAPPLAPAQFAGLTVTEDHYLVVGVLEPAGLLIFDLHAGGVPQQVLWPAGVPFVPFDMSPMPGGGAWILDRVHRCYWALDRSLNIVTEAQAEAASPRSQAGLFQTEAAGEAHLTVSPSSQAASAVFPLALNDPIAIEALPDCSVLILDHVPGSAFSSIYRYVFAQQRGMVSTSVMKDLIEQDRQATFRLHGYDIAFVPEHAPLDAVEALDDGPLVPDRLYVVSDDGNQAYAFNLSLEGEQLVMMPPTHLHYYPMRLFGGKGLVASATLAYYDCGDRWIPLVGQVRSRYVEEATLHTPLNATGVPGMRSAFDGRVPDCTWHRLLFDASVPSGTQVQVWSRAANNEGDLEVMPWQAEPVLYQRGYGSELPFAQAQLSQASSTGTWELLFQQAKGRYLQLKLTLSGNTRSTPHIRAMRIYYPRFSYLDHYLPALYREDSQSASFLERFLANVEGFNTAIEDKIVAVRALFNICSTPAEALEWLASWFGLFLDPAWNEAKQRLFLKHAMDFFRWRGTMRGLQMALRLALEDCADESIFTDMGQESVQGVYSVRIVEAYRTRFAPGVVFGDPTDLVGLRPAQPVARWVPRLGRVGLVQSFDTAVQEHLVPGIRNALLRKGVPVKVATDYPILPPAHSLERGVWEQASRKVLGFVPAAQVDSATDTRIWQDFLQRRYRHVGALNTAHEVTVSDFAEMPLYTQLPFDGAALQDWYQFETIVLPMRKAAHRFTVLLPVDSTEEANSPRQQRRDLARRIIELEKPAHTTFEVRFYWAFFRIGEARLGLDTLINRGSRAPQLFPPLTLGRDSLGESFLAPGHPYDVPDRFVLGRDRLEQPDR